MIPQMIQRGDFGHVPFEFLDTDDKGDDCKEEDPEDGFQPDWCKILCFAQDGRGWLFYRTGLSYPGGIYQGEHDAGSRQQGPAEYPVPHTRKHRQVSHFLSDSNGERIEEGT